MTLKVGDKVLATEDRYSGDELTVGKKYEVAAILDSNCVHLKGIEGAVYRGRLEKIEDTPKFQVGDRVRWNGTAGCDYVIVGRSRDLDHKDPRYDWRLENERTGHRFNAHAYELTKIESVPFEPSQGDKVANLKTGREGVVLMGQVWDKDISSRAHPVPVKALVEYEEHHPGTYDLIKKDEPW